MEPLFGNKLAVSLRNETTYSLSCAVKHPKLDNDRLRSGPLSPNLTPENQTADVGGDRIRIRLHHEWTSDQQSIFLFRMMLSRKPIKSPPVEGDEIHIAEILFLAAVAKVTGGVWGGVGDDHARSNCEK